MTFGDSIYEIAEVRCIMKTLAEVKGDEDNIESPLRIKWLEEDEFSNLKRCPKDKEM